MFVDGLKVVGDDGDAEFFYFAQEALVADGGGIGEDEVGSGRFDKLFDVELSTAFGRTYVDEFGVQLKEKSVAQVAGGDGLDLGGFSKHGYGVRRRRKYGSDALGVFFYTDFSMQAVDNGVFVGTLLVPGLLLGAGTKKNGTQQRKQYNVRTRRCEGGRIRSYHGRIPFFG